MAKVKDKASVLSEYLLLFPENFHERYICNVERINSLKLSSVINLCLWLEISLSQRKFNDYQGLKTATEGYRIPKWRLPSKKIRTHDAHDKRSINLSP